MKDPCKVQRGQPHSKTYRIFYGLGVSRSVLECGCPLPLFSAACSRAHLFENAILRASSMNKTTLNIRKIIIVCAIHSAAGIARAQYSPPPPPEPFPGFINEALRAEHPTNKWDIGGVSRSRIEIKQGFGIPGAPGSVDFRAHGADVDNEYFLERIRLHAGYTNHWWSAYVEGQSSLAASDERFAYVNSAGIAHTTTRRGNGSESD